MSVKGYVAGLTLVAALALSSGCEWSSGGGASGWSDSYNWVNFSGTYRGIGGGVLVTDYSTTPGTSATTNRISGKYVGATSSGTAAYGGYLAAGVVARSVQITIGGYIFTDSNGDGDLTSSLGGNGKVTYTTGRWDVNLEGLTVESGKSILVSYTYVIEGSSGSTGASSGASGVTIYSFVVWQNGQVLEITDNNGRKYSGSMGSVSGTMNASSNTAVIGDSVVAQFSAEGVSAANYKVTIAGTFQGVVGGASGATYLNNRKMYGTWIEEGGRTGDVNGEASPIVVTGAGLSTSTTTTE